MAQEIGRVSQIIGPVIDVTFDTAGRKAEEVLDTPGRKRIDNGGTTTYRRRYG